jgi:hypothetical protein
MIVEIVGRPPGSAWVPRTRSSPVTDLLIWRTVVLTVLIVTVALLAAITAARWR